MAQRLHLQSKCKVLKKEKEKEGELDIDKGPLYAIKEICIIFKWSTVNKIKQQRTLTQVQN